MQRENPAIVNGNMVLQIMLKFIVPDDTTKLKAVFSKTTMLNVVFLTPMIIKEEQSVNWI